MTQQGLDMAHPEHPPLVMLVDGHNMIFRSFSSVPRSITDGEGKPVNGVYGLVSALLRLIRDKHPSHILVAFDVPSVPTFRHKLFPAYQGQRGPLGGDASENFAWQVDQAVVVLEHFGIHTMSFEGFEADDVMGTVAREAGDAGLPSLVVSSDRDLQQLVRSGVRVLIPGKASIEVGPEEVRERLGVEAEQIVAWKALAGDSSDNIPGLPGIGDKSAIDLLARFSTLEGVYSNLESISTRQRTSLENNRELADLFMEVVRIREDLPLDVEMEVLRLDPGRLPESAGSALREVGLRPAERSGE